MSHPERGRLAQIIASWPGGEKRYGSGYLVTPGWVLTAAHVVAGAESASVWLGAPQVLEWDSGLAVGIAAMLLAKEADLALLPVRPPLSAMPADLALVGRLDRESVTEIPAVAAGFPRFKLRPAPGPGEDSLREVQYATGLVNPGSNMKTDTFALMVLAARAGQADLAAQRSPADLRADPQQEPPSPWEGMSGAAMFACGRLIGVVAEHHSAESAGTLTIRPLVSLFAPANAEQLTRWQDVLPQLNPSADQIADVTPPTAVELVERRAQQTAARLAPQVLVARDDELAALAAFVASADRWRWIQGAVFAGKTALLAWFALHPPPDVDMAACFLRRTNGTAHAAYALEVLNRQLARHAEKGEYAPAPHVNEQREEFLDLLQAAAQASQERGHRLVVLVDGLDEDRTPESELSVAAWLPDTSEMPDNARLLVASRAGVSIDLSAGHALRRHIVPLTASEAAGQKASARGQSTVIQAGGDVITGDVFVGRFARLRDKWLDPARVFDEVQVERFTGREWLLEPVDRFLAAHDRGYVIVQADAGLGKTTLAAWLAWSRGWPSHFTRRSKGRVALTALSNLAVQLIARYHLDEQFAPRGILPETAGEPGWFDQVLRAAAQAASASGQQVVIVVDGLDEAEAVEGDLPLGLPAVLPRGAFIVATCRTGTNLPALRRPWKRFSIEPGDPHNTDDLERFLHTSFTEDQELESLLSDAGVTAEAIATRLLNRCGGVWVYLRYVLEELSLGLRSVDEIDELPADLAGYYAESLMAGHDDPEWGRLRLPLLATLAVTAESLSVATLTRLAGLPDPHLVHVLCGNRLRPFLTVTTSETGERRYGVYHASLREFLAGRGPATLADGGQAQREELAFAAANAHSRIADHYFTAFGGLQSGLPFLAADPSVARQDDGYALRYLGEHLERAGRPDDLDALLACAQRAVSAHGSVWFAAHEQAGTLGDYRADIDRARRRAAASADRDVELGRTAPGLGQELRYLIIDSAVRTLTTNVPSALIARLVESGLWTPARGLFYARQPSDLGNRAIALATLVSHVPEHDRPAVTGEAIATAGRVSAAYGRAWAFSALLEELPEPHPDQLVIDALAATTEVMTDEDKAICLSWLIDYLPESLFSEAVGISLGIHDESQRTRAIIELIPRLPDTVLPAVLTAVPDISDGVNLSQVVAALAVRASADVIPEIVAAARVIPTDDDRAWALGIVAAHMGGPCPDLASEALASARAVTDPANRAWALSSLSGHFSDGAREELLDEALSAARSADKDRVWALVEVAEAFPSGRRRSLLAEALRTTLSFLPGPEQTDCLAGLAEHLPKRLAAKAVSAALAMQSEPDRATVLTSYAPYLPDQLIEPVLKAAVEMREETHRGSVLRALVPFLPDHLIADALSAATSFSDASERNRFIAVLADRLPDRLLSQALSSVQSMTNGAGSAQFLRALAIRMEAPQSTRFLMEALDAARSVTDEQERAQALGDVAASLNEPQRGRILGEAIQAAMADPYDSARVYALDYLIPVLSPQQRKQAISDALKIARAMRDPEDRAVWLADLTRRVPRSERKALLTEALETARMVPSDREKLLTMAIIAASVPDEQGAEALNEFRSLSRAATKDMSSMVRMFTRLTRVLPDQVIMKMLRLVRQAMYQDSPLTTAARVLHRIPNAILTEVLDVARNHFSGFRGSHMLGAVSLYMPAQLRQNALDLALTTHPVVVARRAIMAQAHSLWREGVTVAELDIFRQIISGMGFDECLNVLASALEIVTQIAGTQALDDCLEAFRTVQRWWPPAEATGQLHQAELVSGLA